MGEAEDFVKKMQQRHLAALYEKDYPAAVLMLSRICRHAENRERLSENHEKMLNQIRMASKRFAPEPKSPQSEAFREILGRLNRTVHHHVKRSSCRMRHTCLGEWEESLGLSRNQQDLLYKTVINFQLTIGCSNFCRRCNEWALPKVRACFSFEAVNTMLHRMAAARENGHISLYGASDPLDWEEGDKTILDIVEAAGALPLECSLLTKLPRGRQSLLKELVRRHADLAVSVTSRNKKRVRAVEQEMEIPISRQHDLDELLIPAGLDEDFTSVKPSITDSYGSEITPDGAYLVVPTFTSALYPFGHDKIPVTPETDFFPVKKSGREALLVDYFKPLEGYGLDGGKRHKKRLLDVQAASILLDNGSYALTPPGMRSMKEYLSIFQDKARCQRKTMVPLVIKKLKQQHLAAQSSTASPAEEQETCQRKIQAYLDLCDPEKCLAGKLYALSFFLETVHGYAQTHPDAMKIIVFLLKDEIRNQRGNPVAALDKSSPAALFSDTTLDSFDVFRYMLVHIITGSIPTDRILSFTRSYPAVYDPIGDWFIHRA